MAKTPEELEASRHERNARKRAARAAMSPEKVEAENARRREARAAKKPPTSTGDFWIKRAAIAAKMKKALRDTEPVIDAYRKALEACADNAPLRAELRETMLAHGAGTMSSAAAIQTMATIASVATSARVLRAG